jgi:hypothetical protein
MGMGMGSRIPPRHLRFMVFQSSLTIVIFAVVLWSHPNDPKSLIVLVGLAAMTPIYAFHVRNASRGKKPRTIPFVGPATKSERIYRFGLILSSFSMVPLAVFLSPKDSPDHRSLSALSAVCLLYFYMFAAALACRSLKFSAARRIEIFLDVLMMPLLPVGTVLGIYGLLNVGRSVGDGPEKC